MSRYIRPDPDTATAQQVIDEIRKVTNSDWETGYSFAHIVLDDMNLRDSSILYCLHPQWISEVMMERMDVSVRDHKTLGELEEWQVNVYRSTIDHMLKVCDILHWLLDVDEDVRRDAEDLYHGVDETE